MIYAAQDYLLDHLVIGCIASVVGLLLIIFHKSIKEWGDCWHSKDFPIGAGEMWTGKYTRGGLIFTYAVIILTGAILLGVGIGLIVHAVRGG
jgi:hypothetical protein